MLQDKLGSRNREQPETHCARSSLSSISSAFIFYSQAFPSISTGIYGYPIEDATHLALDLARRFCETEVGSKASHCLLSMTLSLYVLLLTARPHHFRMPYSFSLSWSSLITFQVVWSNKDKGVYE
jgi:O-acetyl-ADP-ribose deacetylase (regulator of RNase III)